MKYFDYASTTPVDQEVLRTYQEVLQKYFVNSESIYPEGQTVNRLIDKSRQQMADLLGVRPNEIIFTSGGSEANNLALKGYALKNSHRGKHIITSVIEHSSVLNSCHWLEEYGGFEVTYLPVGSDGKVRVQDLREAIREDTILVSIMYVNNESGAIQPIDEIKKVVREYHNCVLHCDCVQALGKLPIDLHDIEMASFSAHKIYGLKGSGFLMRKQHIALAPVISGGQQEQGIRGGTANGPSDMVLGKTMRLALTDLEEHEKTVREYRDYVREKIAELPDIVINSPADASPFVLNFSCLSVPSEVMMNALSLKGYCVSAQSTCDSGNAVSHVISQMFDDPVRLKGTIRLSFSHRQNWDEIKGFVTDLKEVLDKYG